MAKQIKLFLLLLFPLFINAQSCPPGKSFMPSISNSGVMILADTCLSDSLVADRWKEFFNHLGNPDTTAIAIYTNYRILSFHVFDSTGWNKKEVYQKKVNGVWVEISKCSFYWDNKTRLICWGGQAQTVQIPCCGHFHKTKPK